MSHILTPRAIANTTQMQNTDTETLAVFCHAQEASILTALPLRTFHLYVKQGLLPSYKIGRNRLFKKDELVAAIMSHRTGTKAEVLS